MATLIWQMVHWGFFFPEPLGLFCQIQITDRTQDEMANEGKIVADFKMIHAHLAFAVFEEALDMPPAECYVQEHLDGRIGRGVGEEIFYFFIQHVARHDEPAFFWGKALFVGEEPHGTRLPDDGPFLRVLNMKRLPRRAAAFPQLVQPPGGLRV